MTRRILAIGGGSFLMEDEPSPIDEFLLRLTGKPRPRVCFVPTPSGDLPEHIEKFYATFNSACCDPSHLAFFRKPSPGAVPLNAFEPHILSQDVIYVGGGNTKSALGVWREWGLDKVLVRAYQNGVLLAGMSAGAICWFAAGLTDSVWGAGYQPLSCLGLLQGGCSVHHGNGGQRRESLHSFVAGGLLPQSVAIDDYAAVLYEDEALAKTVAWRPGAAVHKVAISGSEIVETLYECSTLNKPSVG